MAFDPPAREYQITYGSLTVGGVVGTQAGYHLHGFHEVRMGHETAEVGFDVIVAADSRPEFLSRCVALEAAFAVPFAGFTITLGASSILALVPNAAFDAEPEAHKVGDDGVDSARSRRYRCSVRFQIPAASHPTEGLRTSRVSVEQTPAGRRTMRVSGTFTAVGSNEARAQYDAKIAAFAAAALTALGITQSELFEETTDENTTGKLIDFSRSYREIVFSQGGASLDDSQLKEQSLRIAVEDQGPGDTDKRPVSGGQSAGVADGVSTTGPGPGKVHRLATIRLSYEVWVDKDVSTALRSVYIGLRGWLVEQMKSSAGTVSAFAIIEESPEFDWDQNRILARIVARAALQGQTVLEQEITARDQVREGLAWDPVWDENAIAAYVYQGPAEIRRTVTMQALVTGEVSLASAKKRIPVLTGIPQTRAPAQDGQWFEEDFEVSATPVRIGTQEHNFDATRVTGSRTFILLKSVAAGSVTPGSTTPGGGSTPIR